MKRALLSLAAATAVLLSSPLAQGEGSADEMRIGLRAELLRLINHDRAAHGLAAVQLDPQASAVGDAYCRNQIRNGTTGHFTVDGIPPYMRYSLAGGDDGVVENAAAWSASYTFNNAELLDMMRKSEQAMLHERPPHDGHRHAILDPFATHVGIGLAWEGGEFRLTQEFLRRYVAWTRPLPRSGREGEPAIGAARPAPGFTLEAISVHYEPIPQPLSVASANAIGAYSLPERRRVYLPRLRSYRERGKNGALYEITEQYADGRRGDIPIDADGSFTFNVPFTDGPGVYTVVVWVKRERDKPPLAASNISIRVDPTRTWASATSASR